jgi:hypothetical protein
MIFKIGRELNQLIQLVFKLIQMNSLFILMGLLLFGNIIVTGRILILPIGLQIMELRIFGEGQENHW